MTVNSEYYLVNIDRFINDIDKLNNSEIEDVLKHIDPYKILYIKGFTLKWANYIINNNIYFKYNNNNYKIHILTNVNDENIFNVLYDVVDKDEDFINGLLASYKRNLFMNKLTQQEFDTLCGYITTKTLSYIYNEKDIIQLLQFINTTNIKSCKKQFVYLYRSLIKKSSYYNGLEQILINYYNLFPNIIIANIKSNINYVYYLSKLLPQNEADEIIKKAVKDKRFIKQYDNFWSNNFDFLSDQSQKLLKQIEFINKVSI